ncbi:hypothetical protein ACFL6U_19200 [Planctomycetota bacterium]
MKRKAFTVAEMTIVLGMGALSVGLLTAGLHRIRQGARVSLCGDNIRSQMIAREAMQQDNDAHGMGWSQRLSMSAGQIERLTAYSCSIRTWQCPSNDRLQRSVKTLWELRTGRPQARQWRVPISYFLVPEDGHTINTGDHTIDSPRTALSVGYTLDQSLEAQGPCFREQIVDHVFVAPNNRSHELTQRAWLHVNDSTNHLNAYNTPLGGNIGFVDGHVQWRNFRNMHQQRRVIDLPDMANSEGTAVGDLGQAWLWW